MFIMRIVKWQKYLFIRRYSSRNVMKLKERDMFHDIFPDTAANSVTDLLNSSPQCVYAGFDPTADSLHVGNLLILMNLLHWQRGGHQPIGLIGGATAKIGDPSGRNKERDQLDYDFIENNIRGIKSDIERIFSNHEQFFWKEDNKLKPLIHINHSKLPKKGHIYGLLLENKFTDFVTVQFVRLLNNDLWYNKLSAVQLIGTAGRYLRMGTLLSRTSVQNRLESPVGMSFTEFSYQLFQAYDWLYLFKNYNCRFQIGGNDQMGNIMSGHELIRKSCNQSVYGLTMPLITTEMGDKFGKSAGNAMWLSSNKTSPFTLYQFFVRLPDSEIEKHLKLLTFEPIGRIKDLIRQHKEKPELRLAQKYLAKQIVLLVHGEVGLESAIKATEVLYEGSVTALANLNPLEISQLFEGATIVEILPEIGQNILDLAMKVGCFSNKDDAVRIITAGGFYINQQKTKNPSEVLNLNVHRLANNVSLLRVGKRNYYVVKWLS